MTVGNLIMGGTGKTPLIAKIIEEIGQKGALYITRGYGADEKTKHIPFIQKANDICYSKAGDEALLLAKRFSLLQFIVSGTFGKSRSLLLPIVEQSEEIDWIIVDDGLQHDEIVFDVKIVTIDATNPYGYSWLLPRGLLRERPQWALPSVDYIILTNCNQLSAVSKVVEELENRWQKPVIPMKTILHRFFSPSGETVSLPEISDVYIISGIAAPQRVQELLEKHICPSRIKAHYKASDHAHFSIDEISCWLTSCLAKEREKGGNCPAIVISTEKDWVRIEDWSLLLMPVFFMEIAYEPLSRKEKWGECIEKINCAIGKKHL